MQRVYIEGLESGDDGVDDGRSSNSARRDHIDSSLEFETYLIICQELLKACR